MSARAVASMPERSQNWSGPKPSGPGIGLEFLPVRLEKHVPALHAGAFVWTVLNNEDRPHGRRTGHQLPSWYERNIGASRRQNHQASH